MRLATTRRGRATWPAAFARRRLTKRQAVQDGHRAPGQPAALARDSDVIYALCHGIVDEETGFHLDMEPSPLGRLSPAMQAGAGAFIGALAPVPTTLAMQFAERFSDAHLGRGLPVPEAVFEARRSLASGRDPTWIRYTVYDDLSSASPDS